MMRNLGFSAAAVLTVLPAIAWAQDTDGDQVPDATDAYPCDSAVSAVAFAPGQEISGSLLFEDRWPSRGDLDFNDLSLGYNYVFAMNAAGQVRRVTATFDAIAVGGTLDSGLGLVLPINRSSVATVTRRVGAGASQPLTPSAQDSLLTITVSDNLRELFDGSAGAINSRADQSRRSGARVTVEIAFAAPVTLSSSGAPYDVFIFRSEDPTHQIHRPEFAGTTSMNTALFNSSNDGSTSTRHFVDEDGLPFVLAFPLLVDYPGEEVLISALYPRIIDFARSGGVQASDFYVSGVQTAAAYRDAAGQGRYTPPAAAVYRRDTSCIRVTNRATATNGATPNGVAVGSDGTAYVVGTFQGTLTIGSVSFASAGNTDAWIAAIDPDTGNPRWAVRAGSTQPDGAHAVAVSGGVVYVTGFYATYMVAQTGFLTGIPASNSSNPDVFVAALDATTGATLWTTRGGSDIVDRGYAIATDGTRIYVGGLYGNTPTGFGAGIGSSAGADDAFVVALDVSNGAPIWAARTGGTSLDQVNGLAVYGDGVFVAGQYNLTITGFAGSVGAGESTDVFAARLDAATGAPNWAVRGGSTSFEVAFAVAASASGVYVAGYHRPNPTGFLSGASAQSNFVAAFNPDTGATRWVSRATGGISYGLAATNDAVYTTGNYCCSMTGFLAGAGAASGTDAYVAALDPGTGAVRWAQRGGGTATDGGTAIGFGGGRVFAVGTYQETPTGFISGLPRFASTSLNAAYITSFAP